MPVTRDDVVRAAELARLGLDEARIPSLIAELSVILEHVEVLGEVDTEGVIPAVGPGAGGTPLREDGGAPIPLAHPIESFAPRVHHGFFLVPRLASHEEGAAAARAGDE